MTHWPDKLSDLTPMGIDKNNDPMVQNVRWGDIFVYDAISLLVIESRLRLWAVKEFRHNICSFLNTTLMYFVSIIINTSLRLFVLRLLMYLKQAKTLVYDITGLCKFYNGFWISGINGPPRSSRFEFSQDSFLIWAINYDKLLIFHFSTRSETWFYKP